MHLKYKFCKVKSFPVECMCKGRYIHVSTHLHMAHVKLNLVSDLR